MRRLFFGILAATMVIATSQVASADQTGDFSFSTAQAVGGYSGSGTFTTDSSGVITALTGTLYSGAVPEGAITLLAPGNLPATTTYSLTLPRGSAKTVCRSVWMKPITIMRLLTSTCTTTRRHKATKPLDARRETLASPTNRTASLASR